MAPPAASAAQGGSPRRTASRNPEQEGDRFALPTASMIHSNNGKLVYGLQERLCLRVRPERRGSGVGVAAALWTPRQSRQSTASSENISDTKRRTSVRPSPYVAAILDRERQWGLAATQQRAAARCANTSYGSRVQDAAGVSRALTWVAPPPVPSPYLSQAAAALTAPAPAQQRRCITAPAPAAAAAILSWDVGRQLIFEVTSPRFAAHAASDALRASTPDPEPARKEARLAYHAARRASTAMRTAAVQALADTWPHGLPAARRLSAQRNGLGVLGGVGYGASAQSMPQAQYLALKSTLKGP